MGGGVGLESGDETLPRLCRQEAPEGTIDGGGAEVPGAEDEVPEEVQ
jgi:hypothetical protein